MTDHFQAGEAFFQQKEYKKACEEYEQAIELQPDYADAYYNWGNALGILKQYKQAGEKYQKATELNPNYAEAYINWGNALGNLKQYEEAIEKYQKATEIKPDFADTYFNWGIMLGILKQYKQAGEKYQKATEIKPDFAEAYIKWGVALFNLKQYEEAIEKYQKATELNSDYAEAYINWGNALFNLKQYQEAIEKYQKATEIKPDFAEAYFKWGVALFNLKQYEEAIEKYQKAIEINPDFDGAYFNWGIMVDNLKQEVIEINSVYNFNTDFLTRACLYWGIALSKLSLYEEAIEKYQKATELNPYFYRPYFHWGNALGNLNQYQEAGEKYQKATELNSDYAEAYINWGNALVNLNQYEEAIEKYQKATELKPDDFLVAYLQIALIYWQQGAYKVGREKWEAAAKAYNRSQAKAKQDKDAETFLLYGMALEILNDLDKAEKKYQEGLEIDANNIDILIALVDFYIQKTDRDVNEQSSINWSKTRQYYIKVRNLLKEQLDDTTTLTKLGTLHLSMEEYEEAENYLLKALEKDADSANVHTSLGALYIRKEDFKKSTEYFKKALKINPDDLDVKSNLAEAYLKLKQLTQAESEYRKILSITSYHVESHIGLGEVYVAMGEEGEADIYSQAIRHFTKAIEISNNAEGSKQLSPKELAAVQYQRGYTRVKLYENSTVIRDENLLSKALEDFKNCVKKDPENYKGRRAIEKLQKQTGILRTQTLSQSLGTLFILVPSLSILVLTQVFFWKPFFSQENNLSASQNLVPSPKTETKNNSPSQKTNSSTKISQPSNKINTTEYFLLTFGSLTFSLISLYLPQLLKLKIGGTGIELEKSSIDQIKTSQLPTSLGINK